MIRYSSSDYKIILASQSPRRKELLGLAGMEFETIHINADESYPADLAVDNVPEYIAEQKANHLKNIDDETLVITADTVVIIDNIIYGKPKDRDDAIKMLKIISGVTHKVITGVCIKTKEKKRIFSEETFVTFFPLLDEQIEYYVDNFKPFDKAGSYAIQEWIGVTGIKQIDGCYFNVMGLPVSRLIREMSEF